MKQKPMTQNFSDLILITNIKKNMTLKLQLNLKMDQLVSLKAIFD